MGRDSRTVLTERARRPDFTVRYGDDPNHVADVRLPTGTGGRGPAPLVLFLHGGFWRDTYDRSHTGPLATDLAAHGFAVATPEYRRTGVRGAVPTGGGWPATFDDVGAAVRAVPRLVADRAEVDPGRVVLAGHSAGGHLALWAAAGPARRTAGPAVLGVVALAPVADLRAAHDLNLGDGAVAALLGGGPAQVPDRFAASDPMSLLPLRTRIVLVHGGLDRQVPVDFSRRFAAVARAAGDEVSLVDLPEADHFAVIDPRSSVWPAVLGAFHAVDRP